MIPIIRFYKKFFSPLVSTIFGGSFACRFYPSCSEYTQQAIEELGVMRGLLKGIGRILRCNSLFKGGVDLLS